MGVWTKGQKSPFNYNTIKSYRTGEILILDHKTVKLLKSIMAINYPNE